MRKRQNIQDEEAEGQIVQPKPIIQEKEVFQQEWMNNCYKEVIFPDESCTKVLEIVNAALSHRVLRPQDSEQKQQALYYLLGPEFTEQNFPRARYDPLSLEPPKMLPQQKERYITDMKLFLKNALKRAMKDCHYPSDMIGYNKDDELGQYLKEVRDVYSEGLRKQGQAFTFQLEAEKMKNFSEDEQKPAPVCERTEVDVAGDALVALVKLQPEQKNNYIKRLEKSLVPLPLTLRQFFWHEFLFENEKSKMTNPENDIETAIIMKFYENLEKQLKAKKLNDVNENRNKIEIDLIVIDIFEDTPSLKVLASDDAMVAAARVINILDVYSKKGYSPTYVYYLAPLLITFYKETENPSREDILKLASELDLVLSHCQLSPDQVWKIAEEALENVEYENDMDFISHMRECLSEGSQVGIKIEEFPPECLIKKDPLEYYNELKETGIKKRDEELFASPDVFIRKWITQGFMGVLSMHSALWAWDQLYLTGWSEETMLNLTKAVLSLLQPWVMVRHEYKAAAMVLMQEPANIYLSDLRQAYQYFRDKKGDRPKNTNFLGKRKYFIKEEKKTGKAKAERKLLPILPVAATSMFDLDINLDSDPEEEPEPSPEPSPRDDEKRDDSSNPKEDEPRKPSSPQVIPSAPNLDEIWVPRGMDEDAPELPEPSSINEPFELYIDSIRCLPDDVAFVKVTGKVLRYTSNPREKNTPEVVGYPVHSSPQICPSFRCRLVLNKEGQVLNQAMSVLLRVYGITRSDGNLVVVGSCVLDVFTFENGPPELRVGGHQLRLRHGLPTGKFERITSDAMIENTPIPGATICVRLLPHKRKPVSPPLYESGYYDSRECRPTEQEMILYQHYTESVYYDNETVGDACRRFQRNNKKSQVKDGPALQKFLEKTLNHKLLMQQTKTVIPDLDYSKFLTYDITAGLNVDVQCAFGLPRAAEKMYTMTFVEILPGKKTLEEEKDDYGPPIRFQMSTIHLDFLSATRSPQWLDEFTNMRPLLDENSILLVQIYGISPKYTPLDGFTPGDIVNADGGDFSINLDEPIAWTITPIFSRDCVIAGLHWLPLFEGTPPPKLLHSLRVSGPFKKIVLDSAHSEDILVIEGSSIEIKIWDNQLAYEDLPLTTHEDLIALFPPTRKFKDMKKRKFEKTFDVFVVDSLDSERAMRPVEIEKERDLFKDAANMAFFQALNEALQEANKEPIPRELYMNATPPPSPPPK